MLFISTNDGVYFQVRIMDYDTYSANDAVGKVMTWIFQGYIFWPEKFPPPPSKILPCFCGFFAIIRLHKGILTCDYFFSFPPFPFLFS